MESCLYEGSCALEDIITRTVLNFYNGPRVLQALFLLRGIHHRLIFKALKL